MACQSTISTLSQITVALINNLINRMTAWCDNVNAAQKNLSNLATLNLHGTAVPEPPATGDISVFVDPADGVLKARKPDGTISVLSFVAAYYDKTLSGAINGTNGSDGNADFTYLAVALPLDHFLYKGGIKMIQGVAYTMAHSVNTVTITFLAPYIPVTGDLLDLKIILT